MPTWTSQMHGQEKQGLEIDAVDYKSQLLCTFKDGCIRRGTYFAEISILTDRSQWTAPSVEEITNMALVEGKWGDRLFRVNLKPKGMGQDRLVHAGLRIK